MVGIIFFFFVLFVFVFNCHTCLISIDQGLSDISIQSFMTITDCIFNRPLGLAVQGLLNLIYYKNVINLNVYNNVFNYICIYI